MHTELGIQHYDTANVVYLFQVLQLDPHALEKTGAKSHQLQFGEQMFFL